jgi:predicted  nucleic acid-binding Zn-ribbon protein
MKMNFSQNFEQSNWANSVHADEVSSSDYKRLFSLLEDIYAEAVACEVGKLAKERCCGCEYDHPSQHQHGVMAIVWFGSHRASDC